MKIAFVVSGNGYGHLKRVSMVVNEIFSTHQHSEVLIIGASGHAAMLEIWGYTERFNSYSFSFQDGKLQNGLKAAIPDNYSFQRYSDSFSTVHKILKKYKTDILVSDNLTGILSEFPEAILMGSFLWSDTLLAKFPENPEIEKICRYENAILEKFVPRMVGIDDMAMPFVREKTRFTGLPWFCEKFTGKKNQKEKMNVLVTGGGTQNAIDKLLVITRALISLDDISVSLDNALYTRADESWKLKVSRFDFSESSFNSLNWIICRPGIGILTDAIRYDVPVYVVEEADKEMQFNCDRVVQMGIGVRAGSDMNHISAQINSDPGKFLRALAERKTGGAALAARYILNS